VRCMRQTMHACWPLLKGGASAASSGRAINTAVRPRLTSYTRQHHERARTASDMQTMDWEHAGPPPPPPRPGQLAGAAHRRQLRPR